MAAGHGHLDPAYVAQVLALVRNSGNGNGDAPPSNANEILQRGINELWSRIQADPTGYVMNRNEFQLFNYHRITFGNNQVARDAVARFWNNFHGEPSEINGIAPS